MTTPNAPHNYQLVAFDLGGVLVRISRSWQEAASAAGLTTGLANDVFTPFTDLGEFDLYQSASLDLDAYVAALTEFSGVAPENALDLHNSILLDPYPGTEALVEEIEATGIRTGCLSNTNAAHWDRLIDPARYPAIARLQIKAASHLMGLSKPDPEIFRRYAAENQLAPSQIVFFDDDARNVASAREVGFMVTQIDPSGDTAAQIRQVLQNLHILPA